MASIIERIQEVAGVEGGDDELVSDVALVKHAQLFTDAVDAYGSWEAALIASLCDLVEKRGRQPVTKARDESAVFRQASPDAREPVYASTTDGAFFYIDGNELEITEVPEALESPDGHGPMNHFAHIGTPDGIFVFSNTGRYYGMDPRMIPQWMGSSPVRSLAQTLPLHRDEFIMFALPRRVMFEGRIIHITRQGKGKASDVSEYGRMLDRSGKEAFLLNDGDSPVAVLSARDKSFVFCASAKGQGIQFDAGEDMRSMGRKAVGVNVMKLDGDDDSVVSAFISDDVEQVAVITRQGYAKRLWFDEFRPQGRGGSGMQVCRLDDGDRVVGVVACDPSQDLMVATSTGRYWRLPAGNFELMGRPARGNRLLDLAAGESVIGLSPLPCSSSDD
jgi:hypothetical protein